MKKVFFVAFAVITLLTSCEKLKPEGEITTRLVDIPQSVNQIEVDGGFELLLDENLQAGKIEIMTHENVHQYIRTDVAGSLVKIYITTNKFDDPLTLKAKASKDQYEKFIAAGGSKIYSANTISKSNIVIIASGGASVNLPVSSTTLTANSSGGSTLDITGNCQTYNIGCSGGGYTCGYDFVCDDANVSISGGSELKLTVNKSLQGENSGGSKIYYKGNPSVFNVNNTGGSTITKK